jgi:hypothetical protein
MPYFSVDQAYIHLAWKHPLTVPPLLFFSQAAFSELSRQGHFPDPIATAIEASFMPWLYAQADGHFEDSSTAFTLVNEILQHAVLTHEDIQRKADEEAIALAKSKEVVVEEEGFLKIFVQGIEGLDGPGGPIHVSAKDTIEEVEKKIQVQLLYVFFFRFCFIFMLPLPFLYLTTFVGFHC